MYRTIRYTPPTIFPTPPQHPVRIEPLPTIKISRSVVKFHLVSDMCYVIIGSSTFFFVKDFCYDEKKIICIPHIIQYNH